MGCGQKVTLLSLRLKHLILNKKSKFPSPECPGGHGEVFLLVVPAWQELSVAALMQARFPLVSPTVLMNVLPLFFLSFKFLKGCVLTALRN